MVSPHGCSFRLQEWHASFDTCVAGIRVLHHSQAKLRQRFEVKLVSSTVAHPHKGEAPQSKSKILQASRIYKHFVVFSLVYIAINLWSTSSNTHGNTRARIVYYSFGPRASPTWLGHENTLAPANLERQIPRPIRSPTLSAEVWAPLWVARWADDAKLPLWINLSGCVAAGVGNGRSPQSGGGLAETDDRGLKGVGCLALTHGEVRPSMAVAVWLCGWFASAPRSTEFSVWWPFAHLGLTSKGLVLG